MSNMHKFWKDYKLGLSIEVSGYSSIEIDECELVGNENVLYWMISLIERSTKEVRIYCVLNNKAQKNLLKIIEDNVVTDNLNEIDLYYEFSVNTGIYSDYFQSYQPSVFKEKVYIHKDAKHNIWFGNDNFHTNTIEGL